MDELAAQLSPMWACFGFAPNWADYREDDFWRAGDELSIQPLWRWLAVQFAKHGAAFWVCYAFMDNWLAVAVSLSDKADFQAACAAWGLSETIID